MRRPLLAGLGAVLLAGCGGSGSRSGPELIAFNRSATGQIFLVAADGSTLRPLLRGGEVPYGSLLGSWSPDGKRIALTGQSGAQTGPEIFVAKVSGGEAERIAAGAYPEWSPDGKSIAFSDDIGRAVQVTDTGGGNRQVAARVGEDYDWSPDSSRFVFTRGPKASADVYVSDLDGGDRRRLTHDPAAGSRPIWSPDSTQIAFESTSGEATDIDIMAADGSGRRRLVDVQSKYRWFDWAPDGKHIVFEGDGGIEVIDVDGTGRRHLTDELGDELPEWSPDGESIAFVRGSNIYVMNSDGSGQHAVTHGEGGDRLSVVAAGRLTAQPAGTIHVARATPSTRPPVP